MATEEKLMFYAPDKENLEILENMGLRYDDIAKHYETYQTASNIKYYFRKFGIHHKSKKEVIRAYLENDPFHSSQQIAIKFGVSARFVNMVKAELPKMTCIKVWYDGENKDKFHCIIQGHSGYAPKGYDIVCASVSILSQFVVNTISEWKDITCNMKNGYMDFSYSVDCDYEYYITSSLVRHFLELSLQYPDNVRVIV